MYHTWNLGAPGFEYSSRLGVSPLSWSGAEGDYQDYSRQVYTYYTDVSSVTVHVLFVDDSFQMEEGYLEVTNVGGLSCKEDDDEQYLQLYDIIAYNQKIIAVNNDTSITSIPISAYVFNQSSNAMAHLCLTESSEVKLYRENPLN